MTDVNELCRKALIDALGDERVQIEVRREIAASLLARAPLTLEILAALLRAADLLTPEEQGQLTAKLTAAYKAERTHRGLRAAVTLLTDGTIPMEERVGFFVNLPSAEQDQIRTEVAAELARRKAQSCPDPSNGGAS